MINTWPGRLTDERSSHVPTAVFLRYRLRGMLVERDEAAREQYDYPVEPRALPLPEDTVHDMERMIAWYDAWMDWNHAPQPNPSWDEAAFTAAARRLLDKIRRELGSDYEIVDEEFSRRPADPEE